MAQFQTIRGVSFLGVTGIQRDPQSQVDRMIANLPRLSLVIDPARLDSQGQGVDAMQGAPLAPSSVEVATSADFGDRQIIRQNDRADRTVIARDGLVTPNFSLVVEFLGVEESFSGAANLFSASTAVSNVGFIYSLRTSAGLLRFYPNGAGGSFAQIASGIVAGQRHVVCVSWDSATREAALYLDNVGMLSQLIVATEAPTIISDQRYAIGGRNYSPANGWIGDIGRTLIFDEALHKPEYGWVRGQAFAALATSAG